MPALEQKAELIQRLSSILPEMRVLQIRGDRNESKRQYRNWIEEQIATGNEFVIEQMKVSFVNDIDKAVNSRPSTQRAEPIRDANWFAKHIARGAMQVDKHVLLPTMQAATLTSAELYLELDEGEIPSDITTLDELTARYHDKLEELTKGLSGRWQRKTKETAAEQEARPS